MKKNMPRGLRNNNPGNIRKSKSHFEGEISPSEDKSFKQFKTVAYGYRAMFRILSTYYNCYKLDTIRKMISRWAPPKENNTAAYIKMVSDYAGIGADEIIHIDNREMMIRIVCGMSKMENGEDPDINDVIAGWILL